MPKIAVHVKHTHNILVTRKSNAVTHTLAKQPFFPKPDMLLFHFATGERTSGPNFRIKHSFSLTAILSETVKKKPNNDNNNINNKKNAALKMRT